MEKVARLIEKFIPENYNLFLDINRKDKSFKGSVTIKGEAKKQNISLHQNELEITTVKIDNENVDFTIDRKNDEIKTSSNKTGNINVYVEFTGNITDNMMGMYPSYYTENGEKKELIATQLASHFARKVFPSIDEPEAKASFDLAIKFDQKDGEIVIANMPEIEIENRKQTGIWKFDTTTAQKLVCLPQRLTQQNHSISLSNTLLKASSFMRTILALNTLSHIHIT